MPAAVVVKQGKEKAVIPESSPKMQSESRDENKDRSKQEGKNRERPEKNTEETEKKKPFNLLRRSGKHGHVQQPPLQKNQMDKGYTEYLETLPIHREFHPEQALQ